MTSSPILGWTGDVRVNGTTIADDAMERLASVQVEQHLHLADVCTLRLADIGDPANLGKAIFYRLFDTDVFPIGGELEVDLGRDGSPANVFSGEITGLEMEVGEDGIAMITVRAYARSHRLQRGRQSKSFLEMTDSDIVRKVAQGASLQVEVDDTTTQHAYVLQYNQTDWEFLRERAALNGFELFVSGRTLYFREPKNGQNAGPEQKLWDNLQRIRVTMSTADQVGSVVVRAWDVTTKEAIVGTASNGNLSPTIGETKTGAQFASDFGEKTVYIVNRPVASQDEADTLAKAIYDELDASFVEAEGTSLGDATIKPGLTLKLSHIGTRLDGDYYITSAVHSAQVGGGYTTSFSVGGRRSAGLYELMRSEGGSGLTAPSVVTGVVTDNTDSEGLGRVKVKLPWLDDSEVSTWARLASPMAGSSRGLYCMPEINDEVVLAFEHGDPARPFVLGMLWNGVDQPPKTNSEVVASSKVNTRLWSTRAGHTITLDDTEGSEKITIVDKTSNNKITIDSASNTISVDADADFKVTAKGNVNVTATGDATVDAQNATVTAKQSATITANQTLTLTGKGEVKIEGAMVTIKASGTMSVDGGGMLGLKGGLVNIN